ncbi:MAG TPA: chorismate synthase [Methanobacteriales archaeon]|nr:MAG: Chorismate synthase [Methanobacteriaceae archaeon 41_258]MBC7089966.1 chorismate synthase [Methanobacteriaceae archaeon]MBC7096934.1 chorismate synthase [Methanobacteriales archaeon]MDI3484614.1 chorismate synthase [Methanobacteriaceae archaeon]HIH62374.1 chorismate synthase [Methanobacteriales archaeon]
MGGNTLGKIFQVTTFGSSHGRAIGAVVDGCPAGLSLGVEDIQRELDKRRPGTSAITTPRREKDKVEILSGIFQGKTDGTPIAAIVYNEDVDSSAYEAIKYKPRPGHGDYTWRAKFGHYDYRGGGRGSGRITIGHVIGGAIAKKLLETFNIKVIGHVTQIGNIKARRIDPKHIEEYSLNNLVRCADKKAAEKMEKLILDTKKKGDSVGGIVEVIVLGAPAGLGEPVFSKLDADIAYALMGIGSVKGVEIGLGFKVAECNASEVNDEYYIEEGEIKTITNNSGGIIGGISNGMPIVARIAVKPTPSISLPQKTINFKTMKETTIQIKGRHDPCICPRIVPVAEASIAIIIADHLIRAGFIHPCRIK